MKDATQDLAEDVTQDVTQDVAEDVSGAAEDESVIFHRPPRFLGRHVKDGHVKDVAQGVAEGAAEGVPQDMAQKLAFGARAPRAFLASPPPPPPPSLCSSC